jgi:AraC family transcriptional regulator
LQMPAHNHRIAYLSFVLCGSYKEKFNRKSRHCFPGQFILHPPDETHSVNFQTTETRILRIEPSARWLKQNQDVLQFFENLTEFQKSKLNWLGTQLYLEFQKKDKFAHLAIQGLMLELLAETGRQKSENIKSNDEPRWLAQVEELVREEFNYKFSLKAIAEKIGVHSVYLSREFRRRKGCTLGEFVRQIRIEKACSEISKGKKELCEIACETGFYDQSHFTNTFKNITGMTPAEYRSAFQRG